MLQQEQSFDLASEHLDDQPDDTHDRAAARSALLQRLDAYRILPPAHDRLPEHVLELVEQLFVTWFELRDDGSRRAAISYIFAREGDVRTTLLAIVPLYYDATFFDDFTPTRDLVEIMLVAHAKWRRWLSGDCQVA
jgi:hypothetical protein